MFEQFLGLTITVLSGVLVYILSQWYTEFILRPIQEYKKLKSKVGKYLVLYACYYCNPRIKESGKNYPAWEDAGNTTRELAAEVAAFAEIKPLKVFTPFSIPSKKNLLEASTQLIGLSNSYFETDKTYLYQTIAQNKAYVLIVKKNLKISRPSSNKRSKK